MKNQLLFASIMLLLLPTAACAYLDPGTGNILVYVVVSLCGALLYSLRGAFWALSGKNPSAGADISKDADEIVLFSEGKSYWNTFKPVVESLIEMGQAFRYFTMDVDDPGLKIENDYMQSKYIGEGSAAFARMGQIRATVMLATTPNIGTPGFPFPRPPHIKYLAHVCHGVDDIGLYKKGSLDHYDIVFIVGDFMVHGIRYLEKLRGLKEKELLPAGLPYLDDLASKMKNPLPATDGKTVLVAPSWGTKGCLFVYGSGFIRDIAEAGFNVILRPHPHSWKVEADLMEKIKKELAGCSNVKWDRGIDGAEAMEKADILVSDTSNIRMDFALLYERPVITLKVHISDPETFEFSYMDGAWMDAAELEIGSVLDEKQIGHIGAVVKSTLDSRQQRSLADFRNKNVYNFGHSGHYIAEYLVNKIDGRKS